MNGLRGDFGGSRLPAGPAATGLSEPGAQTSGGGGLDACGRGEWAWYAS